MKPQLTEYCIETQTLKVKLVEGGHVLLDMQNEYFAYYGEDCDIELDFGDTDTKRIYFNAGSPITASEIIQWAQKNHDEIHREALWDE